MTPTPKPREGVEALSALAKATAATLHEVALACEEAAEAFLAFRIEAARADPPVPFREMLPTRVLNIFRRDADLGDYMLDHPEEVAQQGYLWLMNRHGMGRLSMWQVAKALEAHGLVEPLRAKEWRHPRWTVRKAQS